MDAIPSWARIGAKCIFIGPVPGMFDDAEELSDPTPQTEICTVTEVEVDYGRCYIKVAGYEAEYFVLAFRPVIDQRQDIAAHFAHHLETKEPANV